MNVPTISDQVEQHRLLHCRLSSWVSGAWHAEVRSDSDNNEPFIEDSTVSIDFGDGSEPFVGRVRVSQVDGGTVESQIDGGKGNLVKQLPARSYVAPTLRSILESIARDAGGEVSSTVDETLLATRFERWVRPATSALVAADLLAKKLGSGHIVKVLRDGTLWIGKHVWSVYDYDAIELSVEVDKNPFVVYSPERMDLDAGVIVNGRYLTMVMHWLRPDGAETAANFAQNATDQSDQDTKLGCRIRSEVYREIAFGQRYPARVVVQHADLTVDLMPDDDVLRGFGLAKIPIRYGVPGWRVKVKEGSRCRIVFDGADASRPHAVDFDEADVEELIFNNGTRLVATTGDSVGSGELYVQTTGPTSPSVPWYRAPEGDWTIVANGPIPPTPGTSGTPVDGLITSGVAKLKAGG